MKNKGKYYQVNPCISVVMSVYNGEKTVANAIESILNQSYSNFEFVIVDDASVDNTREILTSYKDPRIKILTNDVNLGLTKSLNFGIKSSIGEIIARMDADDFSSPDRLSTQVSIMQKGFDICSTRAIIENTNRPRASWLYWKVQLIFSNPFIHGSLMFTREIYDKIGGYDEDYKYAQDYKFIISAIIKSAKIHYISNSKYKLSTSICSISSRFNESQRKYATLARNEYRKYLLYKIKGIFLPVNRIGKFFDPIRNKNLLSDLAVFEQTRQFWLMKNNDQYFRKPIATRNALIEAYKHESKNYLIYINYLIYRYLYFLCFFRILFPFSIKLPDLSKIASDSICFTLGVDRARPYLKKCQDLPCKIIKTYALYDSLKILKLCIQSGVWEPYYHVAYLEYQKSMVLYRDKLKSIKYICEDCGDISSQILISNSTFFKSVEMHFSAFIAAPFITRHKVITNNELNYRKLKELGNKVELKKYKYNIFSGSFKNKKPVFELGVIMPLSTDKPIIYEAIIKLIKKLSINITVFVSYHPQELKITNFKYVRERNKVSDHEFIQSCSLFITAGSSLDELAREYKKIIITINSEVEIKSIDDDCINKYFL